MSADKKFMFAYLWKVIGGGFPEYQEEYNFDASIKRKHRFDFAFPEQRVAVEVNGNAWSVKGGGRHGSDRDLEKLNIAASMGWRVFQFSPKMLKDKPDECLQMVKDAIQQS